MATRRVHRWCCLASDRVWNQTGTRNAVCCCWEKSVVSQKPHKKMPRKSEQQRKKKKNESEASEPKMLDGKCFKARLQKRTNLCNWFWGQWSQRAHPTPDGATSDGSHWRSSQALSCQSKMKSLQITLLLEKNGGYFAMRLKQKTAYFRSIFTYNYLEKCQP